ncbi:MAG: hypothetical protein ACLP4R_07780 [Solirubrobacteraceae bacterium]
MRRLFVALALGVALALSIAGVAQAAPAANAGAFTLTANSPGGTYAPTFTGNGMLGVRVPPSGQGYAAGTVPAQSELAGFYAWPSGSPTVSQNVQQRANIPTRSTLTFSDGGQPFTVPGPGVSNWRQSLELHTGVVTTSARWTAPDGHVADLTYQVLTDRASQFVGLVRMQLTPQWSGVATVTDAIDGTADTTNNPLLTNEVSKGWNTAADQDWVTVQTVGTNIQATLASQLQTSPNVVATNAPTDQSTDQSVGQQLTFPSLPVRPTRSPSTSVWRAPRTRPTPSAPLRARPPRLPTPAGRHCWRPTTRRGQHCGTDGSRCGATRRWPPT